MKLIYKNVNKINSEIYAGIAYEISWLSKSCNHINEIIMTKIDEQIDFNFMGEIEQQLKLIR